MIREEIIPCSLIGEKKETRWKVTRMRDLAAVISIPLITDGFPPDLKPISFFFLPIGASLRKRNAWTQAAKIAVPLRHRHRVQGCERG